MGASGGEGFSTTDSTSPTLVIVVAHFLQSLTHRLVLGGELVYHRRPGEEGAILTLAGKYSSTEEWGAGRFWAWPGLGRACCCGDGDGDAPSLHFGFRSCTLGGYTECGIRWGPCQLLPQSE